MPTVGQLAGYALADDFAELTYEPMALLAVNDCIQLISRQMDLPTLQTTDTIALTAGDYEYSPPADFLYLRSLTNTRTGQKLTEYPGGIDAFDQDFPSGAPERRGDPEYYLLEGANLLVAPMPSRSDTLRIRYVKSLADIATGSSVDTIIPDEFTEMFVAFIRSRLFRREGDYDAADREKLVYEGELARLRISNHRRGEVVEQVGGDLAGRRPRFRRP